MPGDYEFVPGHRIRDERGRELSDGMLLRHTEGRVEVVAVFEAKAGREASRELRSVRDTMSSLSAPDIQELRPVAIDELRNANPSLENVNSEELERTHATQIEERMRSIYISEAGQVRSDIERLTPGFGSEATRIWIDGRPVDIVASPSGTQVLGVVPIDISALSLTRLSEELERQGLRFERLPLEGVTQSRLEEVAQRLFAERVVNGTRFEH